MGLAVFFDLNVFHKADEVGSSEHPVAGAEVADLALMLLLLFLGRPDDRHVDEYDDSDYYCGDKLGITHDYPSPSVPLPAGGEGEDSTG